MTKEAAETQIHEEDAMVIAMADTDPEAQGAQTIVKTEAMDVDAVLESDDMVEEEIPDKIMVLLKAFDAKPAGEDPRYGDEFVLIKAEIEKLAFNDYNAVVTLAQEILENQSKDLRVAGYYLLANTYLQGCKGLIESLQLYRLLLEHYSDCIFPEREDAQRIAVQWLNNNKLLAYVRQHQKNATLDHVNAIERQLHILNETIMARFNDETLCLTSLNNWIKETKKQLLQLEKNIAAAKRQVTPVASESAPVVSGTATSATMVTAPVQTVNMASELTRSESFSEADLLSLMRKIIKQFLDNKDYARAVAYARACRWGGMIIPPNNQGKTALTAPRQSAVNEINRHLQQNEYETALAMCEGLFFENAGHMQLDLQCLAAKAARGMGKYDLANLIGYETAALLQRLPDIQTLRFEDDTPFASAATQGWLNGLGGKNESTAIVANDADSEELLKTINQSCELANDEGLAQALSLLDTHRPQNEKQRFQLRLAMAQLCLDHGRAEVALPILEELNDQAERTSLAVWNKQLALAVAKTLQNALRSSMNDAAEEDKVRFEQRVKSLSAQMCRWDLVQAVQLI